jgi:hypothetical protein
MTDAVRKPILERAAALLAGPYLLGKQALSLTLLDGRNAPPETPPREARRLSITPPEHAIKRRG